jgi:hypothetical protein
MSLYVNADWSALVPAGSPDAAFGIQEKDAKRRGLLATEPDETVEPIEVLTSANEAKEAPPPADKMIPAPANKAVRKPRRK